MPRIELVEGPGRGKTFEIDGGATFGRGRECTVRLEGRHLSRVHARVERRADGLYVLDAGSRNGIYVNGRKVREHLLQRDDQLEIGEFVFVYEPTGGARHRTVATIVETLGSPFSEPVPDSELRAAYERLTLVLETAGLLQAIEDERGAMKALLERVMAQVRAPRGFVMIVDSSGRPQPAAKSAPAGEDEFNVSNVLHHQVSRERRAILGYDVARSGRHAGKPMAILCAPLVAGERYLGFLYLDGPRETTAFRRADLHFVSALASAAATVLGHLRKGYDVDRVWRREIPLAKFLSDIERDCLNEALRRAGGDPAKTAELAGLTLSDLQLKLKEHGLTVSPPPGPVDWKSVEV